LTAFPVDLVADLVFDSQISSRIEN